jgi:DNA-binding transcriptional LysR family regulator
MHQIRYFLAVARTLNFTRAAEECNVAQPSLTRAVQKLEEELGGLLLHRERQHTHLTELGRMMLPHLERTFAAAQAAKELARDVRKGETAPLRVGVSETIPSAVLIGLLENVRASVARLELTLVQTSAKELLARAIDGDFDLVFVSDTADLPDRMRSWTLFREDYVLIAPESHKLAREGAASLADLEDQDMVDRIDCSDMERLKSLCATAAASPRFRHRVHGSDELQRLVRAGFGLAFLPANVPLIDGVAAVPVKEYGDGRNVVVAVMAGRPFTPATDACLRLARARDWAAQPLSVTPL